MSKLIAVRCNSLVKLLSLVVLFSIGIVVQPQKAAASCGDYLQHSSGGTSLLDLNTSGNKDDFGQPAPVSRCRNGNCRSQHPAPLPVKSQIRTVQDRPEMTLGKLEIPAIHFLSSRLVSDEQLVIEPAYDIAEPPPRG